MTLHQQSQSSAVVLTRSQVCPESQLMCCSQAATLLLYALQMLPPAGYISHPATGCASKFVNLSWQKVLSLFVM